jgi:3-hydroxyacyl-[acyl-carrier-protein] dehydratase
MPEATAESAETSQSNSSGNEAANASGRYPTLFGLDGIDLSQRLLDREQLQAWIPHRGVMQLLDSVVWVSEDNSCGIGHRTIRADEFWVEGHFPKRAAFPGVLMVETGAQLAAYLFNLRLGSPQLPAFLRIENCSFRNHVGPGDEFYVLCREVKFGKRRFVSDVQGVVGGNIAFQARLSGMTLEGRAS